MRFILAEYGLNPRITTPNVVNCFHVNEEYESSDFATRLSSNLVDVLLKTTHHTVPFNKSDTNAKNKYLINWLNKSGRCFILARDISWADNPDIENCLSEKASRNEITIFMEKENDISRKLVAKGADVRYYGKLNYVFKNRFIISHWGTDVSRVTTYSIQEDVHINHVYDSTHRIFRFIMETAEYLDTIIPCDVNCPPVIK
jgi:hypothetical protein